MSRQRGFTLIEILAALTMFAIVGGALLQLFQTGLRTASVVADQNHAVYLARSKLTELLIEPDPHPGTLSGDFDDDFRWQAILTPQPQPEGAAPLRLEPLLLTLTVTWGEPDGGHSFELTSLVLANPDRS